MTGRSVDLGKEVKRVGLKRGGNRDKVWSSVVYDIREGGCLFYELGRPEGMAYTDIPRW